MTGGLDKFESEGPQKSSENLNILKVGPRVAEFLKKYYPKNRAKLIGKDFKVSPGTAERWLRGEDPTMVHFERMVAKFGHRFLKAVFWEAHQAEDQQIQALLMSIFTGYNNGLLALKGKLRNVVERWFHKQILPQIPVDPTRIFLITHLSETISEPDQIYLKHQPPE